MSKQSAGILAYRFRQRLEVLLVHPGGPFYARKEDGVWSIPKGEFDQGEDPFTVALREFEEETGNVIKTTEAIALTPVSLKSGKIVSAWAVAADFEQCFIQSNEFEMEWPPRSGRMQRFPEVDKAAWFTTDVAIKKIHPAQVPLLWELQKLLSR